MSNQDYEIVYKEGDEVCFKTYFPDFKYQPNYGGGGLFGLQYAVGLDTAKKIKGEIILIHDDRYHVLVGKDVYICKHSILKPVAKPGGIIFFEVKKKEPESLNTGLEKPKEYLLHRSYKAVQWATLILLFGWFALFFFGVV